MNRKLTTRNNNRRRAQTNRGTNSSRDVSGPSVSEIIYRGPSRLPRSLRPDLYTLELHYYQLATSSAGGIFDTNITSNLTSSNVTGVGVSNANSWGSFSGNYREYRVLAIRADYMPSVRGGLPSPTAIFTQPFGTIVDRDDSSAAAGIANIIANESFRMHSATNAFMRQAKMESVDESAFELVSVSMPGIMTIKSYIAGVGAPGAITFGAVHYSWIVQFRTVIG